MTSELRLAAMECVNANRQRFAAHNAKRGRASSILPYSIHPDSANRRHRQRVKADY